MFYYENILARKFDQAMEVLEIRRCMKNNHKLYINYRTPECLNQLHYFSDTPGSILEMIDSGEEIWEIGMKDLEYY